MHLEVDALSMEHKAHRGTVITGLPTARQQPGGWARLATALYYCASALLGVAASPLRTGSDRRRGRWSHFLTRLCCVFPVENNQGDVRGGAQN
jgi:hypothetical protein